MSFIDIKEGGERLLLVHCFHQGAPDFQEFIALSKATDGTLVEAIQCPLRDRNARFLLGSGKVEEIRDIVVHHEIDLVIFSEELTPTQERNIEKALQCRVIDRSGLILDIFAMRAVSSVGKMQVELARLQHISTRLVRGWTHLERQKGGIGVRGGPGEKQIELDRRIIGNRISTIKQRLIQVHKQRAENRKQSEKNAIPRIALVGYTNAGKSSLFRTLTGDDKTFVKDQLFATLDPTSRRMTLNDKISHNNELSSGISHGIEPILIDTVGFIHQLPHQLVEAFKATLEESSFSDLLLHVVDASSPDAQIQIETVNKVLEEIKAHKIPSILVFNKIDLISDRIFVSDHINMVCDNTDRVWISAESGENIDFLRKIIVEKIQVSMCEFSWMIPHTQGSLRHEIYKYGNISSEESLLEGTVIRGFLPKPIFSRLASSEGIDFYACN